MNDGTKIEWADYTFNPWEGCTKVSPGCANCYAENRNRRWNKGGAINWGKGAPRRRTSEANWKKPLKWNREAAARTILCENCGDAAGFRGYHPDHGGGYVCEDCAQTHCEKWEPLSVGLSVRPRVFCASLADWLDDEVPLEWFRDLLNLIRVTPHLDWLLLTKRPENFSERVRAVHEGFYNNCLSLREADEVAWVGNMLRGWDDVFYCLSGWENYWIGTSAEDQERWDERVPLLMKIPAKVHFVSAEPLLGPIDMGGNRPDWLIVGGESGPGARPMDLEWGRSLRDQCVGKTAFFFKQRGGVGKDKGWRLLDGAIWDEFPIVTSIC